MGAIAAIASASLIGNVVMRMNKWDLLTLVFSVPMMAINVLFLKPGVQGLVELKTTTAKSLREVAGVELLDSLKTWHTAVFGLLVVNIVLQLKASQFVRELSAKESANMTKTKAEAEESEADAKASAAERKRALAEKKRLRGERLQKQKRDLAKTEK